MRLLYIMSFFRAQRAIVLRTDLCHCGSDWFNFRRLGKDPVDYMSVVAINPKVPGAPTITSYSVSGTSITLLFNPGNNGGNAITGYQYSIDNGMNFTSFPSSTPLTGPFTISGLSHSTIYPVIIRALNAIGYGAKSSTVSIVVP
jgi:hypothetical protein